MTAWEAWCKGRNLDPSEHHPCQAANWLADLSEKSSISAATAKKAAAALTNYFARVHPELPPMGQTPEVMAVRAGIEKARPHNASKPLGTFDIEIVFRHLNGLPADAELDPRRHAAKLGFLLMASGLRLGDSFKVSLSRSLLAVPGHRHKCILRGTPKEEKGRSWVDMPIEGSEGLRAVCPHCCLHSWLARRSKEAADSDGIWIFWSEFHRKDQPMASSTVSKYIHLLLVESGVPSQFQTRHVRAAACSAANRLHVPFDTICSTFRWSTQSQTARRHYHQDGGQCRDLFSRISGLPGSETGRLVIIDDDDGDDEEDLSSDGSYNPSSHSNQSEED